MSLAGRVTHGLQRHVDLGERYFRIDEAVSAEYVGNVVSIFTGHSAGGVSSSVFVRRFWEMTCELPKPLAAGLAGNNSPA